ncbi:hypothetical protein DY000_02011646 [Brassica cretica]|uniref:Uncharacterized protein n=1 Tax=Brassica cretica TaxID=69181 RepID=A0ABQ7D6R9_BRACR|nr:hypothetical protein DY000_02011646 [Brassica cretica]
MLGVASLGFGQSLVVFDVVFPVVGLPSIVFARIGFQDLVFGDLTSMLSFITRRRFHGLLILLRLPFLMLFYLVAAFITVHISVVSGVKLKLWFLGAYFPFSLSRFVSLVSLLPLVQACVFLLRVTLAFQWLFFLWHAFLVRNFENHIALSQILSFQHSLTSACYGQDTLCIAFGDRSTAMEDGEYASTLAMPELWNRLQGADCNDKGIPGVVKLRNKIGEDIDAANLFLGLQNHPCATNAQPVF